MLILITSLVVHFSIVRPKRPFKPIKPTVIWGVVFALFWVLFTIDVGAPPGAGLYIYLLVIAASWCIFVGLNYYYYRTLSQRYK